MNKYECIRFNETTVMQGQETGCFPLVLRGFSHCKVICIPKINISQKSTKAKHCEEQIFSKR